jgi:hypothetical protein
MVTPNAIPEKEISQMKPIYLTDMSASEPKRALSTSPSKDQWLVVDYEAEGVKILRLRSGPCSVRNLLLALRQRTRVLDFAALRSK